MPPAMSVEPMPGAKAPIAAVGAGMGVGADDHVTGADQAQFGEQRVLDRDGAAFIIMGEPLFLGEFAAELHLFGRGDCPCWA